MNSFGESKKKLLRVLDESDSTAALKQLNRCIRLLTEDQARVLKPLVNILGGDRDLDCPSLDFLKRVYTNLGAENLMEKLCFLLTRDQTADLSPMEAIMATGGEDWILRRADEIAKCLPSVETGPVATLNSSVGIDGCKAGWVCIAIHDSGAWEAIVLPDIGSVWARFSDHPLLLIDVPIGLVENGGDGRPCDGAARKILGPRASSVFSPPARSSLAAPSRELASEINFRLTGKRISAQAWGIVPKIREVDEFLRTNNPRALSKIREVHPEVLFWGLNGGVAMKNNKKTKAGSEERLSVLERLFPPTREVCNHCMTVYPRSQLALDDVVDALVASLVGAIGGKTLIKLPSTPILDPEGIPMEMTYLRLNRDLTSEFLPE